MGSLQQCEKRMKPLFVTKYWNDTVFLRNTQKPLKITSYRKNFFLSCLPWCLHGGGYGGVYEEIIRHHVRA